MNLTEQNNSLWGNDIPWLHGLREKGRRAFDVAGWPNAKTESWKYSFFNQGALDGLQTVPQISSCSCHEGGCHHHSSLPFDVYEIDFCNGKPVAEHFPNISGVEIKSLAEAIFDGDAKDYLNKSFNMDDYPFAALNTAFLEQGVMIVFSRRTVPDKPVYIRYHTHEKIYGNIRNVIVAESETTATLIEDYTGTTEDAYFNNVVNEIFIGSHARLTHYKRVSESAMARHISLNSAQIKSNGAYQCVCVHAGGQLARSESFIRLSGEGAEAQIDGAYRLGGNDVSDMTSVIRHIAPHTYSKQLIKGVLDGHSKGVFQGKIHIAPDAQQTEGYQLHRALLLSDTAEVDCKPELEIFADDVKCSHGATSGDLDKEQLFYMQSRGIAFEQARQILINAYLNEVLVSVEDENIRFWLEAPLKHK